MNRKNKRFQDLSISQKQKRLRLVRDRRHVELQDHNDSDSSSGDTGSDIGGQEIPPINVEDAPDNGVQPIPAIVGDAPDDDEAQPLPELELQNEAHALDNESLHSNQENDSDDDLATMSSNQEDSDEDILNDIPLNNVEQADDDTDESGTSDDDIAGGDVPQNVANLRKRALKNAFLAANLKHKQGNIILKALREFPFNLDSLPKDSRTLLQTPTIVASTFVQQLAGGEYLHLGFKKTLKKKLESLPEDQLPEHVEIDFSTDGGRANNGADQFWPHQYRIVNIADKRPIIAGIFKGRKKPTNAFEFYEQFVQEIIQVRDEGGIMIRNRRLPLHVRCFIADAPARAFALNHYGHTSAHACSKCKIEGHRCTKVNFRGTMVFQGARHPPRTDEEYENLIDEDHHKGRSPLASIIGLVSQVPYENMHLAWLGNGKKVLSAQVDGNFGFGRLNARKLDILDARMILLRSYCPSEFNRRPSEITRYRDFKATELRQLVLYSAPAVFKDVFFDNYYDHFMIFHSVMRLLSSDEIVPEMYDFCQEALETYVLTCEELYGEQFLSYNVHGLLHVVDDVRQLGPLESFSAFPYENNMPAFRKQIRKPHLCLQQYYKRMCELNNFTSQPLDNNVVIRPSKSHAEGPLPEFIHPNACQQFQKLQMGKFILGTSLRDSCCVLRDSRVCIIKNIVKVEEDILLIIQAFQTTAELYNVGVSSDTVGVYRCSNLSPRLQAIHLDEVKSKSYRMPEWSNVVGEEESVLENRWICVTLLTPLGLPLN